MMCRPARTPARPKRILANRYTEPVSCPGLETFDRERGKRSKRPDHPGRKEEPRLPGEHPDIDRLVHEDAHENAADRVNDERPDKRGDMYVYQKAQDCAAETAGCHEQVRERIGFHADGAPVLDFFGRVRAAGKPPVLPRENTCTIKTAASPARTGKTCSSGFMFVSLKSPINQIVPEVISP